VSAMKNSGLRKVSAPRLRGRVIVLAVALLAAQAAPAAGATPEMDRSAARIVDLTNAFRREQRLSPVASNERLAAAARQFAGYMARTDAFSHDADGSDPSARAVQHGYNYCLVSENIAYEFSSEGFTTEDLARRLTEGWKHSPGHRENMVEPAVTETGVALARSPGTGRYYAVQMFARPSSASIRVEISNAANAAVRYRLGGRNYTLTPRQTRTHEGCRSGELQMNWPGQQETTVQPQNGDRYTVVRDTAGRYALQQQ
jgi:uncharacterized protein YkwD